MPDYRADAAHSRFPTRPHDHIEDRERPEIDATARAFIATWDLADTFSLAAWARENAAQKLKTDAMEAAKLARASRRKKVPKGGTEFFGQS